ncbi:MAG: hypothetical protein K2I56_00170 [Muribaculaceae bacterium]|nr:hypothetical protein [Muribaculaceae bacterium]
MNLLKHISIVLIAVCLMPASASAARHVINISRASELEAFLLSDPDADINIVADIDASNMLLRPQGEPYRGNINGNGHMIKNLRISASGEYSGLFGRMEGCTVTDLVLADAVFTPETPSAEYAGVLCGEATDCTFTNVMVCHTVAESPDFSGCFGGLAGMARDCHITLAMSSDAWIDLPSASALGGLVGCIGEGTEMLACASSGYLRGDSQVGGIAGLSEGSQSMIRNCHSDCSLYARHTVGGIIGYSRRILVNNCLVDGMIQATAEDSDAGPVAGGIIGRLEADPAIYNNPAMLSVSLVYYNIVNLTAIITPDEYPEEQFRRQYDTAHRIVGATVDNEAPVQTGTTDDGEPIYDIRRLLEKALSSNHAVSSLEPLDSGIEPTKTSTEGLTRIADDIDDVFLMQQGFRFGYDSGTPWLSPLHNYGMRLFYERKALNIACDKAELSIKEGETASVTFTVTGCSADWLDIRAEHAYALDILNIEYNGRRATVNVYARMQCDTELRASADGLTAVCRVNAISAVDDIEADNAGGLVYDGRVVKSGKADAAIELYSIDGRKVATGRGSVDVSTLPSGCYVAAGNGCRIKLRIGS